MRLFTDIEGQKFNKPQAVTIGKFDGVHLGHEYLIDDIQKNKDNYANNIINLNQKKLDLF